MNLVIQELHEQLLYAEEQDTEYAEQLRRALAVLNYHEEADEMAEEVYPQKELTMAKLQSELNTDFAKHEAEYFLIKVQDSKKEDEIVINPRPNFELKIQGLLGEYDDALTKRSNPNVRIVEYHFLTKEQLKKYF
jgi:hypothetical protein